ncbi:hypothetical protein [Pseudobdellovibrio exovorus]|nr:hypothetical protein [Pseudobdellovibrio exovorus]
MLWLYTILIIGSMTYAPSAFANDRCPSSTEWHALKTRAFFNKLFVAATTCRYHKDDMQSRYDQVREKLTTTYRPYYTEQIRLANAYYDRIDRDGSTTRKARGQSSEDFGQNKEWDRSETRNLNLYSLQSAQLSTQNRSAFQSYCQQADQVLTQLLSTRTAEAVDQIAINHAYAREHNLTECDPEGRIVTEISAEPLTEPEPAVETTPEEVVTREEPASVEPVRNSEPSSTRSAISTRTNRRSNTPLVSATDTPLLYRLMSSGTTTTRPQPSVTTCDGEIVVINNIRYCKIDEDTYESIEDND